MPNLRQLRDRLVLDKFTIFCGRQLAPNRAEMVGAHAHEQDHLLIVMRPDSGPAPKYRIWYRDKSGVDHFVSADPFGFVLIKAGIVHWIEQTNPEALGGYVCIFANYDETGRIDDPMAEAEPGVRYANG